MKKGKYEISKTPSRGKRTLVVVLSVFLLLVLGVGVFAAIYVNNMLGMVKRAEYSTNQTEPENIEELLGVFEEETEPATEEVTTVPEETEPVEVDYGKLGKVVNILVIGQDSRGGEDSKNSDTMILCTVNKETKTLTLTSFLRDSFTKLPDYKGHTCGRNRVNVAYALGYAWGGDKGAMEMLDMCLENNFGVTIDYNIEIDFEAFEKVINVLGGIDVDLNEDEANYMNKECAKTDWLKADKKVGENHLGGYESLIYARMRHSSAADNDIKRTERQRNVINQIVTKAKKMSVTQLNDIVTLVMPMLLTDMEDSDITTCITELLPLLIDLKMESNQCPTEGSYWGEMVVLSGIESGVLRFDENTNKRIMSAICTGNVE